MELNWSTFLLEIINFLVLVWILKRFLYRPVLSVLDKRRKSIEESLNEATNRHTQAIALEQQYKQRLEEWALEKIIETEFHRDWGVSASLTNKFIINEYFDIAVIIL